MKIVTLFVIGLVIGLAGCTLINTPDGVKGSGVVKTEKRKIAPFASLDVNCPSSIQVRCQEQGSLEISGDDNIIPLITTEVKDGTLYIRSSKEYDPQGKLQILISTPDLKKFAFSTAGEANLSNIKNDRVEIALNGAGSLTATGETKEVAISLSGAGSIDAKELHAVNASVDSTGVGSIDIYATGHLDAKSSGIGEINYYGKPKTINKQVGGMGAINER